MLVERIRFADEEGEYNSVGGAWNVFLGGNIVLMWTRKLFRLPWLNGCARYNSVFVEATQFMRP